MAMGRFGKYSLHNAGTCNFGKFGDLPEVHPTKRWWTSPDLIRFNAIGAGRWERKRECPRGKLFSNSTVL